MHWPMFSTLERLPYTCWIVSTITLIIQIIRFRSNLVGCCTFQFPWWTFNKKSKFCKLKMADVRHFENSFISISQARIIRFRSNLLCRCKFPFRDGYLTKIEIFKIQDGGRTPYWKSFFGYISVPYWLINAKFGTEMKDHMLI